MDMIQEARNCATAGQGDRETWEEVSKERFEAQEKKNCYIFELEMGRRLIFFLN